MNKRTIPNLAKACEVMRLLVAHEGLTQSQVQKMADIPQTTAFRILNTFCMEGFVSKQGTCYWSGPALAQFGLKALSSMKVRELAKPYLEKLSKQTGETAHLVVASGHHALIVEVCDSPNPIRVASRPGTLAEMFCSAGGKVLLAHKSDEQFDSLMDGVTMEARTPNGHTSRSRLRDELRGVAESGYAIDDEEYHEGVRCLAAPVYNMRGDIEAAIGITGTASRLPRDKDPEVAQIVKTAADQLSAQLSNL